MDSESKKVNYMQNSEGDNNREVYLLIAGHKEGPFKQSEIVEKIKEKIITIGELISFDRGKTWKKVFECEEILKEIGQTISLPGLPEDNSFFFSNNEAFLHVIEEEKKLASADPAIINNAKLSKNSPLLPPNSTLDELLSIQEKKQRRIFNILTIFVIIAVLTILAINYNYFKELPKGNFFQKPNKDNILKGLVRKKEFKVISKNLSRPNPVLDEGERERLGETKKTLPKKITHANKAVRGEDNDYQVDEADVDIVEDNLETNSDEIITEEDVQSYRSNQSQFKSLTGKSNPKDLPTNIRREPSANLDDENSENFDD